MKVIILAQSFDIKTGKPNNNSNEEEINTETNELFYKCKTLTDIVETYMKFWNRLPTIQKEMVLVQSIRNLGGLSK